MYFQRLCDCTACTEAHDAPRVEGIDANELVCLGRLLCILFQQLCDVRVVIQVPRHGGRLLLGWRGRVAEV